MNGEPFRIYTDMPYPFTCCGGVDRSHTAMQCTKYTEWTLCYEVVRLSVRLSVTLMCCAQTTERIKLPFRVRVTPKHCDIVVLHVAPDPPEIGVRGTSPKFTQRALPQSHLAVYIYGIV